MSRFFKVRITQNEFHRLDAFETFETFIIHPNKNNFDSFMTEICARLPELFYQPFKLYYEGELQCFLIEYFLNFIHSIQKDTIIYFEMRTNNCNYCDFYLFPFHRSNPGINYNLQLVGLWHFFHAKH